MEFLRGAKGTQQKTLGRYGAHLKFASGWHGAHLKIFFGAARGAKKILRPDTPKKKTLYIKELGDSDS